DSRRPPAPLRSDLRSPRRSGAAPRSAPAGGAVARVARARPRRAAARGVRPRPAARARRRSAFLRDQRGGRLGLLRRLPVL
ncbi:MAG: hypothetical protein AVDCRST_MAG39-1039, partial [uncultured Sphingomonadaceae bacterium]